MSYDCALDKRNKAGVLQIKRINFLPLQSLSNLDQGTQGQLRSRPDHDAPFEHLFIGDVDNLGECFVSMSTPARVPSEHFGLYAIEADPSDPDDLRACASRGDSRIGRLGQDRVTLLRTKWIAYWTGLRQA